MFRSFQFSFDLPMYLIRTHPEKLYGLASYRFVAALPFLSLPYLAGLPHIRNSPSNLPPPCLVLPQATYLPPPPTQQKRDLDPLHSQLVTLSLSNVMLQSFTLEHNTHLPASIASIIHHQSSIKSTQIHIHSHTHTHIHLPPTHPPIRPFWIFQLPWIID